MAMRLFFLAVTTLSVFATGGLAQEPDARIDQTLQGFLQRYCADCHSSDEPSGGLDLTALDVSFLRQLPRAGKQPEADPVVQRRTWEAVVRKLRARQMPPLDARRPSEIEYQRVLGELERALDRIALAFPNPGRTMTMRRMTRNEYQNAIRDLLGLRVDVSRLLPQDQLSHGFDNVTVGELSPTLLNRYVSAAQKISRMALGRTGRLPNGDTYRLPADRTQEEHVDGLPIGTRGGTRIQYNFPQDGQYDVSVRLARDRNEEVEGLRRPHQLEVLLDRRQMAVFTVKPPKDQNHSDVDRHLKARITVSAGPHDLGVTFLKESTSLLETKRQPYQAQFNRHRHPRRSPAVYQVSIVGPHNARGPGDTPSRRRILICRPSKADQEPACAEKILSVLIKRAFRRPVDDRDLRKAMEFFEQGRRQADFEAGIELALSSILVSPNFLFRIERDPAGLSKGEIYEVSDLELASRLSFFLWSSIPDDELLEVAIQGRLRQPAVLRHQVQRMLADARADSLVTNFGGQWLHLRNLDSVSPNLRLFPDFDDNLRKSFRRETELFLADIIRQDRSVLDLLQSDYTFLNERLAKHYAIPHVFGSRFRRVPLRPEDHRGGLLRQGSILTVTSYATRTSPVLRGNWILENLIGSPPPPPPANVPALKDNTVSASFSVRDRLLEHRANPACASCHQLMDPVGFPLENFDAVGRWREFDAGRPVDVAGGMPGVPDFQGVEGLEKALRSRGDLFVATLTEKLIVYALGRGVEFYDASSVRSIVRRAGKGRYRFSELIFGIVSSDAFRKRRMP